MKAGKWHGGKGSADRVTDYKAYDENHKRIFGESKLEKRLREEREAKEKKQ
jgi:hypothetical protein